MNLSLAEEAQLKLLRVRCEDKVSGQTIEKYINPMNVVYFEPNGSSRTAIVHLRNGETMFLLDPISEVVSNFESVLKA